MATSNHVRFVRVRQAAQYLGVSASQIRLLCQAGELDCVRSTGGHRLISFASVLAYCGEDSLEEKVDGIPVGLVGRVSTGKQSKGLAKGEESDLSRQVERLRQYAKERWGDKAKIKEYTRTGSGMNYADETFLKLVQDILNGEFKGGYICASHPDRILRFGLPLFEQICQHGDCEIVFIAENEEKNEDESLADDVLSVITHFSARKYGQRAAETCTKNLSDECVKRIQALRSQNHDAVSIRKIIVAEGYLDSHNETPSYCTIRKYLKKDFEAVNRLSGETSVTGYTLFENFVQQHCVKGQVYRVKNRELFNAFETYCTKQGKAMPYASTIGQYLSQMGLKRTKSNGSRITVGITLKS